MSVAKHERAEYEFHHCLNILLCETRTITLTQHRISQSLTQCEVRSHSDYVPVHRYLSLRITTVRLARTYSAAAVFLRCDACMRKQQQQHSDWIRERKGEKKNWKKQPHQQRCYMTVVSEELLAAIVEKIFACARHTLRTNWIKDVENTQWKKVRKK